MQVTLTIKKTGGANIVKQQTIASISPGQTVQVTFPVPNNNVPIGPQTTVTAEVQPVQGEVEQATTTRSTIRSRSRL